MWDFNLLNNNVNAMHLARTYWGIPSSSFEIGGQYHLPPSACGLQGSGWYWPPISQYSPICPCQMHGIPPMQQIHAFDCLTLHQSNPKYLKSGSLLIWKFFQRKLVKMGCLGKMIDFEQRTFFSKLRRFLMIPDESIKCPNLLNKPAIFEAFKKSSLLNSNHITWKAYLY